MSDRVMDTPLAFGKKTKIICGSFIGAGAANPTNVKGVGVASVTYVSLGKYLVTLDDSYKELVFSNASVRTTTAASNQVAANLENVSNLGTSSPVTFHFMTWETATPGLQDLAVGEFGEFILVFNDSGAFSTGQTTG